MAQSSGETARSAVEVGREQRGGDVRKPGEEGFVHPDGTQQSERQMVENRIAELDREAAGSTVHGAPGQGGTGGVSRPVEPSELAVAQEEHTEWIRGAHEAVGDDAADEAEAPGRHEVPKAPIASSKASESKGD